MRRTYQLYVVRPDDIGPKERFFMITADWTLLYTNRKPPEKNRKVTDLKTLPASAVAWLNGCIEQLRSEHLRSHEREILTKGKVFHDRFEAELEAEKEKLGG